MAIYHYTCSQCNKEYKATRHSQKFCSKTCSAKAWYKKPKTDRKNKEGSKAYYVKDGRLHRSLYKEKKKLNYWHHDDPYPELISCCVDYV